MWIGENEFNVRLGGNNYINTPVLISYKGESLFSISRNEGGHLGIDFEIYNANRQRIARVKKNQIYRHKDHKDNYELLIADDVVTLREKESGKTIAEVRRRRAATAELDVTVSTYLPNGEQIDLGPDTSNIRGNRLIGVVLKDCGVAVEIN